MSEEETKVGTRLTQWATANRLLLLYQEPRIQLTSERYTEYVFPTIVLRRTHASCVTLEYRSPTHVARRIIRVSDSYCELPPTRPDFWITIVPP